MVNKQSRNQKKRSLLKRTHRSNGSNCTTQHNQKCTNKTCKQKGGRVRNLRSFFYGASEYGNCDVMYMNSHYKEEKNASKKKFKNTSIWCGTVIKYDRNFKDYNHFFTLERRNAGFHKKGYSIRSRRYYLPKLSKTHIEYYKPIKVLIGLVHQMHADDVYQKELETRFKEIKEKNNENTPAIVTEINGVDGISYLFRGYSWESVENSKTVEELLSKHEEEDLLTVDASHSKKRVSKNKKYTCMTDIVKEMSQITKASIDVYNDAHYTIETRIKIIYAILFLKEFAYQTIANLLIFFELFKLIKEINNDTVNNEVDSLMVEFYYGRLSGTTSFTIEHIQQVCKQKISLYQNQKKIPVIEINKKFEELVTKVKKIHESDLRQYAKLKLVFKDVDDYIDAYDTRPQNVIKNDKQTGAIKTKNIKDVNEINYYKYLSCTFEMCGVIIGYNEEKASKPNWAQPHLILKNILVNVKSKQIKNCHEDFDISEAADIELTLPKHHDKTEEEEEEEAALSDKDEVSIKDVSSHRRLYTDYIRQKIAVYQKLCSRKVSIEILKLFFETKHKLIKRESTAQTNTTATVNEKIRADLLQDFVDKILKTQTGIKNANRN